MSFILGAFVWRPVLVAPSGDLGNIAVAMGAHFSRPLRKVGGDAACSEGR
jgi:hypothetical protein